MFPLVIPWKRMVVSQTVSTDVFLPLPKALSHPATSSLPILPPLPPDPMPVMPAGRCSPQWGMTWVGRPIPQFSRGVQKREETVITDTLRLQLGEGLAPRWPLKAPAGLPLHTGCSPPPPPTLWVWGWRAMRLVDSGQHWGAALGGCSGSGGLAVHLGLATKGWRAS